MTKGVGARINNGNYGQAKRKSVVLDGGRRREKKFHADSERGGVTRAN